MRLSILVLLGACSLCAQSIPAEWNARQQLSELKNRFAAIPPELDRIDLNRWKSQGVAVAYLSQYESMQAQLKSLTLAVDDLSRTPEKLSVALEIFLRFDALDSMQRSLMEAVRKYEAPELADAVQARFIESEPARHNFRNYLLDLASLRDREYDVMLIEAQRCRVEKSAPPPPPAKPAAPRQPAAKKQ